MASFQFHKSILKKPIKLSLLLPIFYLLFNGAVGFLIYHNSFIPSYISIFTIIQLMIVGFILELISKTLKHQVKNDFLTITKSKKILFYIFLIPFLISPAFFHKLAMCCDCYGGCTMIHGFPFPSLITMQVVDSRVPTIYFLYWGLGFILNVVLSCLLSATIIFFINFFWKRKKRLLFLFALIITLLTIRYITAEKIYNINNKSPMKEGKIYKIDQTPKEYRYIKYSANNNKIIYNITSNSNAYPAKLITFDLNTFKKQSSHGLPEGNFIVNNNKMLSIWCGRKSNIERKSEYTCWYRINDIINNKQKQGKITDKFFEFDIVSMDMDNEIAVFEDMMEQIPVYTIIDLKTYKKTFIPNSKHDNKSNVFIDNKNIAWHTDSWSQNNFKVSLHNRSNNTTKEIINEKYRGTLTDFQNNLLIFEKHSRNYDWLDKKGSSDIYSYDIHTNKYELITKNKSIQINAKTYNNYIVWQDYRKELGIGALTDNNSEIYYKNINTGKEYRLTKNSDPDTNPQIFDNKIVWKRETKHRKYELLLYVIPNDQ